MRPMNSSEINIGACHVAHVMDSKVSSAWVRASAEGAKDTPLLRVGYVRLFHLIRMAPSHHVAGLPGGPVRQIQYTHTMMVECNECPVL